jgi:hypothetical protein
MRCSTPDPADDDDVEVVHLNVVASTATPPALNTVEPSVLMSRLPTSLRTVTNSVSRAAMALWSTPAAINIPIRQPVSVEI